MLFQCVGVSRTYCCGRIGSRWCHIALISVGNIPTFAFYHLVISGVSWSCCLWWVLVPPVGLQACLSTVSVLLGHWKEVRGILTSRAGSQLTLCRAVLPWQDWCTKDHGAAQSLGAGGAQMDPAVLPLLVPASWLYLTTQSLERRWLPHL